MSQRMRPLMINTILEDFHWLIEAKIQLASEILDVSFVSHTWSKEKHLC